MRMRSLRAAVHPIMAESVIWKWEELLNKAISFVFFVHKNILVAS